jgi:hypothetical protein
MFNTVMPQMRGWLRSRVGRRVVAGMATMPSRVTTFPLAVGSIIGQVDRLYLYLDGHKEVPECVRYNPRVIPILAGQEPGLGCDGKFLGLTRERKSCLYLGIDDDIVYPPDYVSHLARELAAYGSRAVVGVHGIRLTSPFASYRRDRSVFNFAESLPQRQPVDILGSGTILFDTKTIKFDPRRWKHKNVTDIQVALEAAKVELPMICVARNKGFVRGLEEQQQDSLYAELLKDDSTHTMLACELLALRPSQQRPWSEDEFLEIARRRLGPLRDLEPGERIVIPMSAFRTQTGHLKDDAIDCKPARDMPGHCLYGPDYSIAEAGTYRVTFAMEQQEDDPDDAVFDVYENRRTGKVLAEAPAYASKLGPSRLLLEFFAERGYRVEFRVYWRGRSRLRIQEVLLERIT